MAVLSRVQRNELFELIRSKGLDPSTFEISTENQVNKETEVLRHLETGSFIRFSFGSQDNFRLEWWPTVAGSADRDSLPDAWADYQDGRYNNRPGARRYAANWIAEVKANNDAPDLWGEIAKERAMLEATKPSVLCSPRTR